MIIIYNNIRYLYLHHPGYKSINDSSIEKNNIFYHLYRFVPKGYKCNLALLHTKCEICTFIPFFIKQSRTKPPLRWPEVSGSAGTGSCKHWTSLHLDNTDDIWGNPAVYDSRAVELVREAPF